MSYHDPHDLYDLKSAAFDRAWQLPRRMVGRAGFEPATLESNEETSDEFSV